MLSYWDLGMFSQFNVIQTISKLHWSISEVYNDYEKRPKQNESVLNSGANTGYAWTFFHPGETCGSYLKCPGVWLNSSTVLDS